jgi:hypothetical protein
VCFKKENQYWTKERIEFRKRSAPSENCCHCEKLGQDRLESTTHIFTNCDRAMNINMQMMEKIISTINERAHTKVKELEPWFTLPGEVGEGKDFKDFKKKLGDKGYIPSNLQKVLEDRFGKKRGIFKAVVEICSRYTWKKWYEREKGMDTKAHHQEGKANPNKKKKKKKEINK